MNPESCQLLNAHRPSGLTKDFAIFCARHARADLTDSVTKKIWLELQSFESFVSFRPAEANLCDWAGRAGEVVGTDQLHRVVQPGGSSGQHHQEISTSVMKCIHKLFNDHITISPGCVSFVRVWLPPLSSKDLCHLLHPHLLDSL